MSAIDQLFELGTSTWLDDLSRERIETGNLKDVINDKSIVGVTTNPAIFAAAMTKGDSYDADIAKLKEQGAKADEAVYSLAVDDVRAACDIFSDIYTRTDGRDGYVSIEVDPRISDDAAATLAQAKELSEKIDRPNIMVKIPATKESLPAITDTLAEGINVNVTLIFSVERYTEVIDAYVEGIRRAAENGKDVSKIHSVASFFVSRLDSEVDKRLDSIGSEIAIALKGKAGVANAQLAYGLFEEKLLNADVLPQGANLQRPLWASTGVKNPDYSPTLYVANLAGPHTVNTMPEATLDATLEHGGIKGDTLTNSAEAAQGIIDQLVEVGINFDDVFAQLEREGVEKFVAAWNELLDSMESRL